MKTHNGADARQTLASRATTASNPVKIGAGRRNSRPGLSRRQRGQAMIEYMVVLAFGVIVLIKPFSYNDVSNPNATPDQAPALQQVAKAIRDYHKHYTYATSIAYIPDCDYTVGADQSIDTFLGSIAGSVSLTVDRCIDWTDPQVPALGPKISLSFPMVTDVGGAIENAIIEGVTGSTEKFLDGFLDPTSLLQDMVGFKPSDFF